MSRRDGDLVADTRHHRIRQGRGRLLAVACRQVGPVLVASRRHVAGVRYAFIVTRPRPA